LGLHATPPARTGRSVMFVQLQVGHHERKRTDPPPHASLFLTGPWLAPVALANTCTLRRRLRALLPYRYSASAFGHGTGQPIYSLRSTRLALSLAPSRSLPCYSASVESCLPTNASFSGPTLSSLFSCRAINNPVGRPQKTVSTPLLCTGRLRYDRGTSHDAALGPGLLPTYTRDRVPCGYTLR